MRKKLQIKDRTSNNLVAFIAPDPDGIDNCWIETNINGQVTLKFILPMNSPKWKFIDDQYSIIADGREFLLVGKDEERDDSGKLLSNVQYEESYIELGNLYSNYIAVEILSANALTVITQLLAGTGWTVGTVDIFTVNDLETEKISCLANLWEAQKIWGGYLKFNSLAKTVSLVTNPGIVRPVHIRYGKNLKNIKRTIDPNVVNRLIPYGKDGLNIKIVNGDVMYVEDFAYIRNKFSLTLADPIPTWAVKEGNWENQDIEYPQELKDAAIIEVAKTSRPKVNYQAKMVDLRELTGYEGEVFDTGDVVNIYDEDFQAIDVKQMVIKNRYNFFQREQTEIEIGDPVDKWDEKLADSERWNKFLDSSTNSKRQITGYRLVDESIIKNKIAASAVDASKINAGIILLSGEVWTNASPMTGFVSWNEHKVAWNGTQYTIPLGNSNSKYIYWDTASPTVYRGASDTSGIPKTAFIIGLNNGGIYEMYWNKGWAEKMIDSSQMGDFAVTSQKIADAAIITAKLAGLAVDATKLADLAVSAAKLADGSITNPKIVDSAVNSNKLAALAVDATKLADLAVTATKIAAAAVGVAAIQDAAISNAKIGNLAVDSAKIVDAAITSAKIGALAVGSAAIANLAVGTAQIADAAILAAKIQDLAVLTAKIQDAAIISAKIANAAVGSAAIANAAIGNAHIADASINSAKIQDLSVVTAKIGDLSVNTIKIGQRAVTGDKVANFIDCLDPGIIYTGTWMEYGWIPSVKNQTKKSSTTGDYLTYTFVGDYVGVLFGRAGDSGMADIYIDNIFQTTVDLYTPIFIGRKVDWEITLPYGTHTVKVVVKGQKNASSTGYDVAFNAFATQKLLNFAALDYFYYTEEKTVTLNASGLNSVSASDLVGWNRIAIIGVHQSSPGYDSAGSPKYINNGASTVSLYNGAPNLQVTVRLVYLLCAL